MVDQGKRIREPENKVSQTRTHPRTNFEKRLDGEGVQDEGGRDWTEQNLRETMARRAG